jgi:hypothetical protein
VSIRLIASTPVALVADDDRIAEHAQLVDEAEPDRCCGQAGAADRDVLAGRVERRSDLLGQPAAQQIAAELQGHKQSKSVNLLTSKIVRVDKGCYR